MMTTLHSKRERGQLDGQFLIAMPGMADSNFARTVIYVCAHSEDGAMGIIVNNAIVLIDTMNRFRIEGMDKNEAIIEAGAARLRPVLMTALTTVLALIPMALGFGTGAELIQPVALVCVGGLTYGTFMTLLVIPALYDWLGAKKISVISEEELTIRDL